MSTSIYFPTNPSTGDTYAYGSVTYKYNGAQWVSDYALPALNGNTVFPRVNVDDLTYYIDTDGSGNLIFVDSIAGSKTLTQLATGGSTYVPTQYTLTASSNITIDFSISDNFYVVLDQNTTFVTTNMSTNIGKSGTIVIKQDAVGTRTFVESSQMKTPVGGAAIDQYTAANSTSILTYYIVASDTIFVNYIGNFA